MNIIAFAGKIKSGKTSCAKFIEDSIILSFAGPLKQIAREQFGWDGEKDEKGRKLLQIIGTEAGRNYNPDIWVNKMEQEFQKIKKHNSMSFPEPPVIIVIDDLRFDNEAKMIKNWGGVIIKIVRKGFDGDAHASEYGISIDYVDCVLSNEGTLEELNNKVTDILRKYNIY